MGKSSKSRYGFGFDGLVALAVGMFAGVFLVSALSVIVLFFFKINLQYEDSFMLFSNVAMFLSAIFMFDFFICRRKNGVKLNFDFSSANLMTYLLIFPMMFGMMLIAESATAIIPTTGPFFGSYYDYFNRLMEQMVSDPATLVVMAVLMAPLFEEIIFRGIILKGLLNDKVRPKTAILISSVLFGLVHGNPWQFVGAVMLGSVIGLVYYKTKSLLLPILLHAFNNACSVVLIYSTEHETFAETVAMPQWIIFLAGAVLFTVFYFFFTRRYRVHYGDA